jgi:hypothetical protein
MTRLFFLARKSAVIGALLWSALCFSGCYAGTGYAVGPDDYEDLPPDFIATAQPSYYEGRPVYWYHDHWHYRDGNHWRSYRSEPAPLQQSRAQPRFSRPAPRVYERPSRPSPARVTVPRGGERQMPRR